MRGESYGRDRGQTLPRLRLKRGFSEVVEDMRLLLVLVGTLVVLTGCGTDTAADEQTRSTAEPSEAALDAADIPAEESVASPPEPSTNPPSAPETVELAETPSLPEGPYYPTDLDRPSDRDSNLLLLSGSPVVATGEPVRLRGSYSM